MSRSTDDYFVCPCCNADVSRGATFCRECGASDDSGWNAGDELLPEDDFDYDEFVEREYPDRTRGGAMSGRSMAVFVVILLLCLSLVLATIGL